MSPEHSALNEALKAKALRNVAKYGLIGVGAGGGLGALLALKRMLFKPKVPQHELGLTGQELELPYPQKDEEEKKSSLQKLGYTAGQLGSLATAGLATSGVGALANKENPGQGALYGGIAGTGIGLGSLLGEELGYRGIGGKSPDKALISRKGKPLISRGAAGSHLGTILGVLASAIPSIWAARKMTGADSFHGSEKKGDWADDFVKKVIPTSAGKPSPSIGSGGWLRGDSHTSETSIPWAIPAGLLAAVAGTAGSWKLMNWLSKKQQESDTEEDLDKAREDYRKAMMGMYGGQKHKLASVRYSLDDVWNSIEKNAGTFGIELPDLNNAAGTGTGAYLALASLLAGGTGIGMYKYLKSRSKSETLRKALKRRAQMRALKNPPELFVNPVPHKLEEAEELMV